MTKQLLIGIFATLLTFGLFGTAFASNIISPHSSEAGQWDYSFKTTDHSMGQKAMSDHGHDVLSGLGTEAGIKDGSFATPKADEAAREHVYNEGRLAQIGTEAGVRDAASGVLCSRC